MITLKIDTKKLEKSMNEISKSLNDLPKKKNMANIARASSSIASKKFIKDVNIYSRANKKQMHHMYEWNSTGQDNSRLFKLHRNAYDGKTASIDIVFRKSTTRSPISKVLSKPGRTGKSVTRSGVFKEKASVMEMGGKASFIAKRTIAFSPDNRRIIFRPKGTLILIHSPGGKLVKGSMTRFSKRWQSSMLVPAVTSTGIFIEIEKNISRVMSKSSFTSSEVSSAINSVCNKYDSGVRDF